MALINKQKAIDEIRDFQAQLTCDFSNGFEAGMNEGFNHAVGVIELMETVDAEPVTRCKDCKWCRTFYHGPDMRLSYECAKLYLTRIEANDFCSKAERSGE